MYTLFQTKTLFYPEWQEENYILSEHFTAKDTIVCNADYLILPYILNISFEMKSISPDKKSLRIKENRITYIKIYSCLTELHCVNS